MLGLAQVDSCSVLFAIEWEILKTDQNKKGCKLSLHPFSSLKKLTAKHGKF